MQKNIQQNPVGKFNFFKLTLILCLITMLGFGCGSGGSNSAAVKQGQFLDSPVEGLQFETVTQSGTTDADGHFNYKEGETISFSIGKIELGSAKAKPTMTPLDLVSGAVDETDPTVTNMVRLLLALDDGGNPDNGIQITEAMRDAADAYSLNFDQSIDAFADDATVKQVVAALTALTSAGQRPLGDTLYAQQHFESTLAGLKDNSAVSANSSIAPVSANVTPPKPTVAPSSPAPSIASSKPEITKTVEPIITKNR